MIIYASLYNSNKICDFTIYYNIDAMKKTDLLHVYHICEVLFYIVHIWKIS